MLQYNYWAPEMLKSKRQFLLAKKAGGAYAEAYREDKSD